MIGVYSITNRLNGKRYIGQSHNIEARWRREKGHYPALNDHILRAFKHYGIENFAFEVLCECRENELSELERFIIAELETYNPEKGYNKTFGGDGCAPTAETRLKMSESAKGKVISAEARKKISEHHKGRKKSPDTLRRMSESQKGHAVSIETRRKMSINATGRPVSDATRQKLSAAFKGRVYSAETIKRMGESAKTRAPHKVSDETKKKMSRARQGGKHPRARPVLQYGRDGVFIREFACTSDADRFFGVRRSNICSAAQGKRPAAMGYVWEYKDAL